MKLFLPNWFDDTYHGIDYSNFSHIFSTLAATNMSFNKWMDNKLWYIHKMGCFQHYGENGLSSHSHTDRWILNTYSVKELYLKRLHIYEYNYKTLYRKNKKNQWLPVV
jgi:hypothetical protein